MGKPVKVFRRASPTRTKPAPKSAATRSKPAAKRSKHAARRSRSKPAAKHARRKSEPKVQAAVEVPRSESPFCLGRTGTARSSISSKGVNADVLPQDPTDEKRPHSPITRCVTDYGMDKSND